MQWSRDMANSIFFLNQNQNLTVQTPGGGGARGGGEKGGGGGGDRFWVPVGEQYGGLQHTSSPQGGRWIY